MTPTKITPALHAYLTDWLAWVDRGAPDGEPYDRGVGLCTNAEQFDCNSDLNECALGSLIELFDGEECPFGGGLDYHRDIMNRTQHLNEARLAWVRSTLATAEIEG
jgi:hypothetical protein